MSLAVLASQIKEMLKSDPEIGPELKARELKEGTIIVVVPPPYCAGLTLWVLYVDTVNRLLMTHAGVQGITTILQFDDAGNVFDNRGLPVFIFEYLGEV